uniref:Uncharacterized protein n=1 Tax=Rhizophora mucronata TaxID=61149 RepID=A0A2P2QCZ3_RHIMU
MALGVNTYSRQKILEVKTEGTAGEKLKRTK